MGAKARGCGGKAAAPRPYVTPGSSPQLWSLLVCTLCCSPSGSQTVFCEIAVEFGGTGANLTCKFSFDLRRINSDVLIEKFNASAGIVRLAVCKRQSDSYWCTPKVNGATFFADNASRNSNTEGSQRLTLGLPLSDLEAAVEGEELTYICVLDGRDTAMPRPCFFPSIGPPEVPVLEWTVSTPDSIKVSWDYEYYGDSPIQGLVLNYTQGSRDWNSVHLHPDNTSFIAKGLLCGTLYHFVLRATNMMGFSSDSQVLAARTNGSAPDMSSRSPLVKEANDTTVTLRFTGAQTDATICPVHFYTVKYRLHGHILWEHVDNNISADVTEMTVGKLTPASTYSMVVTAHTDAGTASCNLHFTTTLPSPHETGRTERKEDRRSGTTTIALASCLAVAALVIFGLVIFLCKRRVRPRTRDTILDDTERESTAGADNVPLQNQNAML